MSFRFLHLADLHLETRFGGRREGVRDRLREATRAAFRRAVDLAIEQELDALLIAGDAFDDDLASLHGLRFFTGELARAARGGVHVLYAAGNHDPSAESLRALRLGLERSDPAWKERVHLFRSALPRAVGVRGRSGAPVGVVVGAGHEKAREARNLAAGFPRLDGDLPVVGLLHTQVECAVSAERHDRYAPAGREDLARAGYDYWALGHVHLRQRPFPDLPAWYAGNLQGRHVGETGAKGGLLVELERGEPVEPRFVPLAPVRWEHLDAGDLAEIATVHELVEHLAARLAAERATGEEELAARLVLRGPTPIAAELRSEVTREDVEEDLREQGLALEVELDVRALTRPRDLESLRRTPCVLSEALALLESLPGDPRLLSALAPAELAELADTADDETRRRYLGELASDLLEELLERGLEEERA